MKQENEVPQWETFRALMTPALKLRLHKYLSGRGMKIGFFAARAVEEKLDRDEKNDDK